MARRTASLLIILGLLFVSCSPERVTEQSLQSATQAATVALTPFYTHTPLSASPTATLQVKIPATPMPTATPFLHTLTNDDTLLGLAFRYGVSLEDLEAANPGIDPHYLTVGKQIIIPISSEITQTLSTPTPVPAMLEQTKCYPTGDQGAWCITAVKNDGQTSLENLSVGIGLFTLDGEAISSEVAYAPLNILRPGQTMPFMAYFSTPLVENYRAQSELLSGISVAEDDQRYLNPEIKLERVDMSADGKQATTRGEVVLPDEAPTPTELWVLSVAYNASGDIVGARKWKSDGEMRYVITVYSLADSIDHVDMLVEARP